MLANHEVETVSNFPELYDMLHDNFIDDISYYLKISSNVDELLEIGIGSGRLAIPLAKAGKIIYGLDNSRQMLAHLNLKLEQDKEIADKIKIIEGDMRNFKLNREFKIIYIPFMTFNYLLTVDCQAQCLRAIYSHLEINGVLSLELISYYPEWFLDDKLPRLVCRRSTQKNEIIDVYRTVRFDATNQILEHDRVYKYYDISGKLIREQIVFFKNRFMFLGEISLLLEKAGFSVTSVFGNYNCDPYNKDSRIMLITATKA